MLGGGRRDRFARSPPCSCLTRIGGVGVGGWEVEKGRRSLLGNHFDFEKGVCCEKVAGVSNHFTFYFDLGYEVELCGAP